MVSSTTTDNNVEKSFGGENQVEFEMQVENSSRQLDIQLFYIHYSRAILVINIHIMNEEQKYEA